MSKVLDNDIFTHSLSLTYSLTGSYRDFEFSEQQPLVGALLHCLSSSVRLRCQYEWFYSTIDR